MKSTYDDCTGSCDEEGWIRIHRAHPLAAVVSAHHRCTSLDTYPHRSPYRNVEMWVVNVDDIMDRRISLEKSNNRVVFMDVKRTMTDDCTFICEVQDHERHTGYASCKRCGKIGVNDFLLHGRECNTTRDSQCVCAMCVDECTTCERMSMKGRDSCPDCDDMKKRRAEVASLNLLTIALKRR